MSARSVSGGSSASCGILSPHRCQQRLGRRGIAAGAAHEQAHERQREVRVRQVDNRLGGGVDLGRAGIPGHADHLVPVVGVVAELQPAAEDVAAAQQPVGKRAADDRAGGRFRQVGRGEGAAGDERDAHGGEELRR